jgi:hypothetical protein
MAINAIVPGTNLPVVPPSASFRQETDAAFQSGDSKNLYSLLPAAQGTSYVPKILDAAKIVQDKTAPIEKILQQANDNGGVGTPKANIAIANAMEQTWAQKQPEVGFIQGLAQGLMGNPNWRKAATQGVITSKPIFDQNGQGATGFYAENSIEPIRVVESGTGREITPQEYEKRNFGKYTSFEQTPGYIQNNEIIKKNAEQFSNDLETANITAAVADTVAKNSKTIYNGFSQITKIPGTQLTKPELDELHSLSTRTGVNSQTLSQGIQTLNSVTDSDSFSRSKANLNNIGFSMGLPSIIGYDDKNGFKLENGSTISKSKLEQEMKNASSSAGQERAFTQNKQALIESKVYKKLPYEAQVILENNLNLVAANEKLKNQYAAKFGSNPLFTETAPWQPGQPMSVGIANALTDEKNSRIANLYRSKIDEARKLGIPDRGSVFQATLRDPELTNTHDFYNKKINEVIQSDIQRNIKENGPDTASVVNTQNISNDFTSKPAPVLAAVPNVIAKPPPQVATPSAKTTTTKAAPPQVKNELLNKLFPKGK